MQGVIVGEAGVGKSSILMRFERGLFTSDFRTTIGVNYVSKEVVVGNEAVKLQVQDTGGQERFRKITCSHYRNADFAIVAYDISNRHSFDQVHTWIDEICESIPETAQVVIIGNKCDVDSRAVSYSEGVDLGNEYHVLFFETSAKSNTNIDQVFSAIASHSVVQDPDNVLKTRRTQSLPDSKSKELTKFQRFSKKIKSTIHLRNSRDLI